MAKGRTLSLEEAAAYALAEVETYLSVTLAPESSQGGEPANDPTRREREVTFVIMLGFTNRQVAQELSISERTAANHVANSPLDGDYQGGPQCDGEFVDGVFFLAGTTGETRRAPAPCRPIHHALP
jgi:hypothetical protein